MRVPTLIAVLLIGLLVGCAGQSSIKPVEALDERTGMTFSALQEPIELLAGAQSAALGAGKRAGLAYMGPVEWNRSGVFSYGLWVHIVPGNDRPPGDIQASATLTLILDAGTLVLSHIEAPKLGLDPYRQAVSWGPVAYFDLDVEGLRRMASSRKLELDVRAAEGSLVTYSSTQDARAALTRYLRARGIASD